MHRVRLGWLQYDAGRKRGYSYGLPARPQLTRATPKAALQSSGKAVGALLEQALTAGGKVTAFRRNPVRWMSYLIAHDAHHRGQILLALKQNGLRLPPKVALQDMWATWLWGQA